METSNEFYGRLNERFEARATVLRVMGFRYQHIPGLDLAAFVREGRLRKAEAIAAGTVLNACERVWADTIEGLD